MADDYVEEKATLTSDFNEAKFKILRLHNSWLMANSYRRAGNLENLRWELDTIWDELSGVLAAIEKLDEFDSDINEVDKEISESYSRTKKYTALRNKYRILKKAQELSGMGGKIRSDAEETIDD